MIETRRLKNVNKFEYVSKKSVSYMDNSSLGETLANITEEE